MATKREWEAAQDLERVLEAAKRKRLLWIHRPILLHDRSDGTKCGCGCDSTLAAVVDEREHIDVLIDRVDGTRRVRSKVVDQAMFDRLCQVAERIDMPLRCYKKQLAAVMARPRVMVATGGVRGGKTTICGESCVDEALEYGGPGSMIWWVAPTLEKTRLGLRKLVLGEDVKESGERRHVAPLFPPELVRSFPSNTRTADQSIRLIDGTAIYLKYADSDSLKGDPPQAVYGDEWCAVRDSRAEETFQQIIDRTTQGGRFTISTTPTAGHHLQEVVSTAVDLDKWDGSNPRSAVVHTTFTMRDNPWVAEEEFEATVLTKSGAKTLEEGLKHPTVRREVLGEWVGEGPLLWTKWDPIVHLFHGASRDAEDYGLRNITQEAARRFFWDHTSSDLKNIAGLDFNVWPMSLVVCQIACHPAFDVTDPANWTLIAFDEVIKRGNVYDFGRFLADRAARIRKLDEHYFRGLAIACDPSGAQPNHHISGVHGMSDRSSTLAKEMQLQGFDCRPCHYSANGNPIQPPVLDSVSLVHKLMRDRLPLPDGVTWQGRKDVPRMLVHADRCPKLVQACETQESDDKGKPLKESGTASDRRSGPPDAFRYLAWGIFSPTEYQERVSIDW